MIIKKYWVPITLIVIMVSSTLITPYVPWELMCNANSTRYFSYGYCIYSSGPLGWLEIVPFLCVLGLVIWLLTYSAVWLLGKLKKKKK